MSYPRISPSAVVDEFFQPMTMRNVTLGDLPDDRVVVKMEVTGLCHTDLHVVEGGWEGYVPPLPRVPGHEGVGYVIACGKKVTCVKVGDAVCVPWLHTACQKCDYCKNGWETLCLKQERTGFSVDGSFMQYCICDPEYVGRVPDGYDFAQAAPITCAGVTTYKAVKQANLKPGNFVVVTGAGGGLGHLACQYAKYLGLKVIGVDVGKNEFIKGLGCDFAIDAGTESVTKKVMEYTNGEGTHGCCCFAPYAKSMAETPYFTRPAGTIVFIGLPTEKVPIDPVELIIKGLRIQGSIVGTRQDLQEALDIAAAGNIHVKLVEKPFSEINDAMEELKTGKVQGRLVLRF